MTREDWFVTERSKRNTKVHPGLLDKSSSRNGLGLSIPSIIPETPKKSYVERHSNKATAWDCAVLDSGVGLDFDNPASFDHKRNQTFYSGSDSSASNSPTTTLARSFGKTSIGLSASEQALRHLDIPSKHRTYGYSGSSGNTSLAGTGSSYSTTPVASSPEIMVAHASSQAGDRDLQPKPAGVWSPDTFFNAYNPSSPFMPFRNPRLTSPERSGYSQPAFPLPSSSSSLSASPIVTFPRKVAPASTSDSVYEVTSPGNANFPQPFVSPTMTSSSALPSPSIPSRLPEQSSNTSEYPRVKLADLGNAIQYGDLKRMNNLPEFVCTRQYRPPENIIGAAWNMSIDIWATACVVRVHFLERCKREQKGLTI